MRVVLACLVVVAAIALPGVIVAATSGSGSSDAFTTTISVGPVQTLPIGSNSSGLSSTALMSTSLAVEAALDQRGTNVRFVGDGPDQVELTQVGGGKCPVKVVFHTENGVLFTYTNSYGTSEFQRGNVTIVYSPPSIGPTV